MSFLQLKTLFVNEIEKLIFWLLSQGENMSLIAAFTRFIPTHLFEFGFVSETNT